MSFTNHSLNGDSFQNLVDEDLYIEIIGNELLAEELNRPPKDGFSLGKVDTITLRSWEILIGLLFFPFFFYLINLAIWKLLNSPGPD
jgi:hypothetical protein